MKIKNGDNVKVISGRNKGKTGKVIQVLRQEETSQWFVVVEGVNLRKKHINPKSRTEKGQILELAAPIHMSNVMVLDPKSKTPTRVGYAVEGGVKKRVSKRSKEFID